MKDYIKASKFPITEIAGRKIPRVILGEHPYDGITYTSRERDEQYLKRWNGPRSMMELMKPIVERFGLTGHREVPTDRDVSKWHEEALRLVMDETGVEIALVMGTALPLKERVDVNAYMNKLCHDMAGEAFTKAWTDDPIVKYQFVDRRGETREDIGKFLEKSISLQGIPPELKKAEVDYEKLEELLNRCKGFKIPLYASIASFDVLILAGRFDEFQKIANDIRKRIGNFLLGTHHAGVIIPMAEKAGLRVDGYLTPINEAGIQMFPTKRLAEIAVRECKKPVIAIKPLGGGRVSPDKAFTYLFQEMVIPCTMVGIGSMEEAEKTLQAAHRALQSPSAGNSSTE